MLLRWSASPRDPAVLQARREADLLYNLVDKTNAEVGASREQREREYALLLGYLGSLWSGKVTKDGVSILRAAVLMFLESVIVLDAAIAQVAAERSNSQPVLFDDCRENLKEQLQMAEQLAEYFNASTNWHGRLTFLKSTRKSSGTTFARRLIGECQCGSAMRKWRCSVCSATEEKYTQRWISYFFSSRRDLARSTRILLMHNVTPCRRGLGALPAFLQAFQCSKPRCFEPLLGLRLVG
jgi:hypothetical protein